MDALQESFEVRQSIVRFKTQRAVAFFGPVSYLTGGETACPAACVAQPLRLRQVIFTPPQRRFGQLALSHIHRRPNVFNQFTGVIQHRVAEPVDVFDLTTGENDSIIYFKVTSCLDGSLKGPVKYGRVFRVNAISRRRKLPAFCVGIESINAILFPGPIEIFLGLHRPDPTAGVA